MLESLIPSIQSILNKIENCGKATVAALNGHARSGARGGGFELALSFDILIASESIKLGFPELNLAIIPGGGGTQRMS